MPTSSSSTRFHRRVESATGQPRAATHRLLATVTGVLVVAGLANIGMSPGGLGPIRPYDGLVLVGLTILVASHTQPFRPPRVVYAFAFAAAIWAGVLALFATSFGDIVLIVRVAALPAAAVALIWLARTQLSSVFAWLVVGCAFGALFVVVQALASIVASKG